MEYLRTLGSAAVSTLVQKSGLNLPFSLGLKVACHEGYYSLYDATKRDDNSPVSVFEYDFSDSSKKGIKPFAHNALKKLRTTRHPDILKFMEAVDSETSIYIMTERVRPLQLALSQYSNKSAQEKEDWLLWGLHRISVALTFINDQCLSTHGKLSVNSIYLSPSGEWKLGGFELFSNPKDDAAVLYTMGNLFPGPSSFMCPEVKKGGWLVLKGGDPAAADAYALGLLLHSVFNPSHPLPLTAEPPHPPPTASSRGAIPSSIFPSFKKLLNPNPKGRLNAKGFLELGMAQAGFFLNNRLVTVCSSLDNFTLASEAEKNQLLRTLKESATSFPPEFASFKILPSLMSALEFGGASAATILPLVLQFGSNVAPDDYPKLILAPIIKLYESPDRGTRMALLEHLPDYVDKLDKKAVSEKIFPHLQLGFSDTVPLIREATVKNMTLIAPKLTDRLLNNDLLRLLAKTQMDAEPSIRTNTCILLGRLGPTLRDNTKRKVLVPAFARALKDSFVHARVAGLMAFMATIDCFENSELASKVIPNMAFTLVDEEKIVRDQAFKALYLFVKKLEEHAAQMPETSMVSGPDGEALGGPAVAMPGGLVNTAAYSAAGAAGSLAGWAISSLAMTLTSTDAQTSGLRPEIDRVASAPSAPALSGRVEESTRPSYSLQPSASLTVANANTISKGRALQLGAHKTPSNVIDSLADQLTDDAALSATTIDGNPWGTDDLIDVNADEDDWSAFETAPINLQPNSPGLPNIPNNVSFSASRGNMNPPSTFTGASGNRYLTPTQLPSRTQLPISQPFPSQSSPPISDMEDALGAQGSMDTSATNSIIQPSSTILLSKEEKALEMARRKEERKQRIAMLKEQKRAAVKI